MKLIEKFGCFIVALLIVGFMVWRANTLDRTYAARFAGSEVVGQTTNGYQIIKLASGELTIQK